MLYYAITVAQNIVIGSQYPVCVALRIAKWFNDRAEYDVARGISIILRIHIIDMDEPL